MLWLRSVPFKVFYLLLQCLDQGVSVIGVPVNVLLRVGFPSIAVVTLALSGAVSHHGVSITILVVSALSGVIIGVSWWVLSGTISLPGVVVLVLSGTSFLSEIISRLSPI